jgi:hypothetical protein
MEVRGIYYNEVPQLLRVLFVLGTCHQQLFGLPILEHGIYFLFLSFFNINHFLFYFCDIKNLAIFSLKKKKKCSI